MLEQTWAVRHNRPRRAPTRKRPRTSSGYAWGHIFSYRKEVCPFLQDLAALRVAGHVGLRKLLDPLERLAGVDDGPRARQIACPLTIGRDTRIEPARLAAFQNRERRLRIAAGSDRPQDRF